MIEISTSILTVEKEGATKTFYNLETAHTDYFHIDIMDGKFVEKNTTELMKEYATTIKQISTLPLDIHFMVENVQEYIEEYLPLSPNIITFHIEAAKDKEETQKFITMIKENNCKVGISIKPNTPVSAILDYLPYIHMVLVMTVEPGKGGQKLIPQTLDKIREIRKYCEEKGIDIDIEVDGGINQETVSLVKEAGANIIVAGTAIINASDYKQAIGELKKE